MFMIPSGSLGMSEKRKRKKLHRKPLDVKSVASTTPLLNEHNYTLVIKSVERSCLDLKNIANGKAIFNEMIVFLGEVSGTSQLTYFNIIKRYIAYSCLPNQAFDEQAIIKWREYLAEDNSIGATTRYWNFNIIHKFYRHLFHADVIQQFELPRQFKNIGGKPKDTFLSCMCHSMVPSIEHELSDDIENACDIYRLARKEASSVVVASYWMKVLSDEANKRIKKTISDWALIDHLVKDYEGGKYKKYDFVNAKSFTDFGDERSVNFALVVLYANHGFFLPGLDSVLPGISDYLKRMGWSWTRVRTAFFPTPKGLRAFAVLALCNKDLMPNVDSIYFYSNPDSLFTSVEDKDVKILLGKKRGEDLSEVFSESNKLVCALKSLHRIVTERLSKLPSFIDKSKNYKETIFLHYFHMRGHNIIKSIDESGASDAVVGFMKEVAKDFPNLAPLLDFGITGENFRSTHMLIARLQGKSIYEIQRKARHKSVSTTDDYLNQLNMEGFVHQRQVGFMKYIVDMSKKSEKKSKSKSVGNGYQCKEEIDSECTRFELCFKCDKRQIVFESVEIVAEWLAWSRHIVSSANHLIMTNPSRWEAIWEPTLAFYEAYLEKTSIHLKEKAKALSFSIILPPLD